MFHNPTVSHIADFLIDIGIPVKTGDVPEKTFLPGITVKDGVLIVDEPRLTYPGDLLHEAGHMAVLSPEERSFAGSEMGDDGGYEMAAIAWSYAAAIHLGIGPEIVFHSAGYRGGSQAILDNFQAGLFIGVPVLQWLEMTVEAKSAGELDRYPHMRKWLRD